MKLQVTIMAIAYSSIDRLDGHHVIMTANRQSVSWINLLGMECVVLEKKQLLV